MPDQRLDPESWVDQHGDYLYRFAMRRLNDSDRAEELVQETFLHALRGRSGFRGTSTVRTWLTSVLKRKILDEYRKRHRSPALIPLDGSVIQPCFESEFTGPGFWRTTPKPWRGDPTARLDAWEFREVLDSCLATLSPSLSQVFLKRERDGLDTPTICQEHGITPNTLWMRLYRARLQLRTCLERKWFGESIFSSDDHLESD